MPYKPNTAGPSAFEKMHQFIWVAAASSAFTFANLFMGIDNMVTTVLFCFSIGGILGVAFNDQTDEYLQAMANTGKRWVLVALVLFLMAHVLELTYDLGHTAGEALADPDGAPSAAAGSRLRIDAITLGKGLTFAFYAGYAFSWVKDRWGDA